MTAALWLLLQGPAGSLTGSVHTGTTGIVDAVVELVAADSATGFASADTVLIDQRELSFVPRTLAVERGTTVLFRNSDPILHNVFSPAGAGGAGGFDLGTYPRPGVLPRRFADLGVHVILCHVHPEMVAYIVVVEGRWRAITDREGRFTIEGVPPGRYHLRTWLHRGDPHRREIEVAAGKIITVDLDIPPGNRRRN